MGIFDKPKKDQSQRKSIAEIFLTIMEVMFGEPYVIRETPAEYWEISTGIFAATFRGTKPFTYGSIFTADTPISEESDMNGFLVFAPSFLRQSEGEGTLYLPDYKIFLTGMYPVYPEEVEVYKKIGLEKFWHHENFDMYDVRRPRVTI